jgi:Domain of unknown function (DUF4159)
MRALAAFRPRFWLILGGLVLAGSACAFQMAWREYPAVEYNDFPIPENGLQPADWVFARLMYPPAPGARWAYSGPNGWPRGNSSWTQDYPRADRHFLTAVRRLTLIDARPVEQPVNLDDNDDVYNWPMLYAVRTGEWDLTDAQAAKLRDYLARGGFFWCDDFWGPYEWDVFMQSMSRVLPGKQPVDIPNDDPIFHTLYDLNDRFQVPGSWGTTGDPPAWRAIYDDKGRIVAAITPASDLGDAWEFADDPRYPEKYSHLAINIGINYVVYALTH